MDQKERKGPDEAAGDGRAAHGYRNEVSWEGGQGRQPYNNQEEEIRGGAAGEFAGGNAGRTAVVHIEQDEAVRRMPEEAPARKVPRER